MNTENFGELIKWPQCVIVGEKLTVDQAKEILVKTDAFFYGYGSNNVKYDKKMWEEIGYDEDADWETHQEWRNKHGMLDLNYLDNSFISSCYVGGVHGWCNPDGTIFDNQNIGKWPSWEEIYDDCEILAKNFPFLNMKVYLFNQEHDCEDMYDYEKKCVGGFSIENGSVRELEKEEFLDASSPYCKSEGYENRVKSLEQMKKNIFGQDSFMDKEFIFGPQTFFSEEEFREYFKEYFYE